MAEAQNKEPNRIKEYAEGWITEREGTEVPRFLKLAFPVIALGCLAYIFIYMNGETSHADRGILVQKFNEVTQSSNGLMVFVGVLMLIFAVIVVGFAFRKSH
jgi:hypothetical protein